MGISIPACFAAAQTSVPGGTATGISSIVRCISSSCFSSAIAFLPYSQDRARILRCAQNDKPVFLRYGPGFFAALRMTSSRACHSERSEESALYRSPSNCLSSSCLQGLGLYLRFHIELAAANHATFMRDVMLILLTEELDAARNGTGGRVAQGAERLAADVIADIQQQVDIALPTVAMLDAMQDFGQPVGSLATGGAFTAGFIAVEFCHAQYGVYYARVLVHDDHAAGAEHRTGGGDCLEV